MIFSNEILETIFSHQTSSIYVLDSNLRALFANRTLLERMGKTEAEIIGKTVEEVGYSPETSVKLNESFKRVLQGEVVQGEELFKTIRGEAYLEYTFAPVKDSSGKVIAISAIANDISKRKKFELELQQSVKELEKERELRESFIMAMTHDLRTPLTAAKLSAQIIQKHPSDGKAINKFSSRIIENIERTDTMIRDLLDSLRLKAGESLALNIQQGIMNSLLESLVDELTSIHGHRFQLEMQEMVKGYWDSVAIKRALENLLTNAIKYGAPEKPITIKLTKSESLCSIAVHNEGEALTELEIADLFVPFKRLRKARESGQTGWGIGLTLVVGILEAHNGKVEVESSPATGTTFTIHIPV